MKSFGRCFSLFTLLSAATYLHAQAASSFTVPAQFATAKTMFLGYGGGNFVFVKNELVLTALQNALLAENRYTLVARPAEAELSMRVSFEADTLLRVTIFDTKTGALLWAAAAQFNSNGFTKNIPKKLQEASATIIDVLETLAAGKVPDQKY